MRLERVQPRGARPERDDLDEIVWVAGCLDECARVDDMHADGRMLVYPAGEVPIAATDHVHHMRLDLDRVHRPSPGSKRLQHCAAATGPEHQHAWPLHQPIGQGGSEILEIRGRR